MLSGSPLKLALKRGALVAAANWPVAIVQAIADSLFKMVILAPLVGGIFLVALVVGAEPVALLALEWRDLAATIVASLVSRPLVLAAFLSALTVAVVGGSMFVFLIKGGTVGILVRGERDAGPIEQPPLHLRTVAAASRFSTEGFLASSRALFPRYARLGAALMVVYLVSGAVYLASVFGGRRAALGIGATLLLTAGFVAWITVVNFVYLLMQVVIAADDCGVRTAAARVTAFIGRQRRPVASVFLIVLAIVIAATGASVLATAALGVIAFIPFLWLMVLPLQLAGWLLRAVVFQYIGLASIGAYLRLYRSTASPEGNSVASASAGGAPSFARG